MLTLRPARPAAPAGDAPAATAPAAAYPFFPVATHKFVAMSLCTLGFYQLYWNYRCWRRIADASREPMSPFWRTFFAPFWSFRLFDHVRDAAARRRLAVGWHAGALGLAYLVLSFLWRLPDPWWLASLLTFVPCVPVVRTIARLHAAEPAAEEPNDGFTFLNVLAMMAGLVVLLLALLGIAFPELEGA